MLTDLDGYQWQGAEQRLTVTGPEGAAALYRFDPWGRVTGLTNALGETAARILSATGRVQKEQGASGGTFVYDYDGRGLLVRETSPLGEKAYSYDGAGRVFSHRIMARRNTTYSPPTNWRKCANY